MFYYSILNWKLIETGRLSMGKLSNIVSWKLPYWNPYLTKFCHDIVQSILTHIARLRKPGYNFEQGKIITIVVEAIENKRPSHLKLMSYWVSNKVWNKCSKITTNVPEIAPGKLNLMPNSRNIIPLFLRRAITIIIRDTSQWAN
jgi:hypothetical protein